MTSESGERYTLNDGFGSRRLVATGQGDYEEVLELSPALCRNPATEDTIRARAAHWADLPRESLAHVRRVARDGPTVRVAADAPAGVRLSDLLAYVESAPDSLSHAGMVALALSVIEGVSVLHDGSGALAHGALAPFHIVVTRECRVVVTDAVYGDAIEALQLNREQLWKGYGLVFPTSASLPRCDQVADVTQLGALVLAIALRRPLRLGEYPHGIADLVSTTRLEGLRRTFGSPTSALHMWLQQALQLRQRATFSNAVQAKLAFSEVASGLGVRRLGVHALSACLEAAGVETPTGHGATVASADRVRIRAAGSMT